MPEQKDLYVLLVDDDQDDYELFVECTALITHLRFRIEWMRNGEDATKHLETKPEPLPDYIILDLNMPIKNGFETLESIKTSPSYRHIPVLVFTMSGYHDHIERCKALGCNGYFKKPATVAEYKTVVAQMFFPLLDFQEN